MNRCSLLLPFLAVATTAFATPQFAREYDMACAKCHAHVPKLNEFGESFLANGYRVPGVDPKKTFPAAMWLSLINQSRQGEPDRFKAFPNRAEAIAAGSTDDGRTSYFIEWRMLSRELLGDGSIRDRSGRFEDLFVIHEINPSLFVQAGQFRALSQIDVSRRLNLSEPLVFSSSLAGRMDDDARIQSLRGFSPAGRSPSLRLIAPHGSWTGVVTIPFPGEFSIPLTDEAQDTASFEFESKAKGVFLEAYERRGLSSLGVNAFLGDNDRTLFGLVGQHRTGDLWFEGGIARAEVQDSDDWRYSIGFDWIPRESFAGGMRLDHRQVAGQELLLAPYVSLFQSSDMQAWKLVFESRLQKERLPVWVMELSWMF